MLKQLILVNGIPASGKTKVAQLIASHCHFPLLSLDAVKEPFFGHIGTGDREFNRRLGRASYQAIFNLIADFPANSTVIVDAWFGFQPIEVLTQHIEHAKINNTIEIWCRADPEVIAARYKQRVATRSPGHPGMEYLTELIELAGRAKPSACFPCYEVNTNAPIESLALLSWVSSSLQEGVLR